MVNMTCTAVDFLFHLVNRIVDLKQIVVRLTSACAADQVAGTIAVDDPDRAGRGFPAGSA